MDDLISGLGATIDAVLRPIVPSGKPCALVGFPNHPNVGDSAIWLGERRYLAQRGISVDYVCDTTTYSPDQLAAQLKDGVILLHGGGNLGDLWPHHQRLREAVIEAFHDKKIVQLPQTIYFKEKANLVQAKAVFDQHPDLTILVRDQSSLEFARNEFRAISVLCPDMSLALGPLRRSAPRGEGVVRLLRADIESLGHAAASAASGVELADWVTDRNSLRLRLNRFLIDLRCSHPRVSEWTWPLLAPVYQGLWEELLMSACGEDVPCSARDA